jgi:hypothetical protein
LFSSNPVRQPNNQAHHHKQGRDNQRPNPVLATPSRDRKLLGQVCWQIVGRPSVILIDCHHASVSHGFTTFATPLKLGGRIVLNAAAFFASHGARAIDAAMIAPLFRLNG